MLADSKTMDMSFLLSQAAGGLDFMPQDRPSLVFANNDPINPFFKKKRLLAVEVKILTQKFLQEWSTRVATVQSRKG